MNTENIIINKGYSDPAKWHSEDTVWVLGLFGTAIGAGVLFLPINAGIGGFWPLLIVFVLAFPITYLAHRGLARFIYSSNTPESSITDVIGEHFGALAGKVFTVIYFFAVYTILIMYAVAITNTAQSFITHQLAMAEPPRSLVAIVLILGLMFIVRFGTAFDNAGDEHPGLSLHHLAYFYGTFSDSALERRNFANRKLQRHGRWAGDHVIPVDDLPGTGDVV